MVYYTKILKNILNYFFWGGGVAVKVVWPVPEASGTVFNTDDVCCDTRNM